MYRLTHGFRRYTGNIPEVLMSTARGRTFLRNNRRMFWEILNRIMGRKNRIIGTGLWYTLFTHARIFKNDASQKIVGVYVNSVPFSLHSRPSGHKNHLRVSSTNLRCRYSVVSNRALNLSSVSIYTYSRISRLVFAAT